MQNLKDFCNMYPYAGILSLWRITANVSSYDESGFYEAGMKLKSITFYKFSVTVKILPNIKSSKKSVKLDAKRHERNVFEKNRMKKAQKLVLAAIANNDAAEATKLLSVAHKAIDQAAANNTIHKNAAARKKSKLTLKVNAIS